MSAGSSRAVREHSGRVGRGEKQGEFLWAAERASGGGPGPPPAELQCMFFILKTFVPSGMTSSKDRGEIKEKSILHYFPSLLFKQGTSVARASPALP